jgi:hypothetical protein
MKDPLIAVVSDVRRGDMGERLVNQVGADYLSIDQFGEGCTWNHSRAWRMLAGLSEPDQWALVLEDDAEPVPGFREQLQLALAAAPAPIVSLYLGMGYIEDRSIGINLTRADMLGAHWVVTRGRILHAVALAVRSDLLPELVDNLPRSNTPIDRSLSMWARREGHQVAYSWPSLVEHNDGPSLVTRYRRAARRAWRTGVRDAWSDKMMLMS